MENTIQQNSELETILTRVFLGLTFGTTGLPRLFQFTDQFLLEEGYTIREEDFKCRIDERVYVFPKFILETYTNKIEDVDHRLQVQDYYYNIYNRVERNYNFLKEKLGFKNIDQFANTEYGFDLKELANYDFQGEGISKKELDALKKTSIHPDQIIRIRANFLNPFKGYKKREPQQIWVTNSASSRGYEDVYIEDVESIVFTSQLVYGKQGQIKRVIKYGVFKFKDGSRSGKFSLAPNRIEELFKIKLKKTFTASSEVYCDVKRKLYKIPLIHYRVISPNEVTA